MPNIDQVIQTQLDRMDKRKKNLLRLIESVPEEKYRLQPAPGTWSVGQVANHLYLTEKLSLGYLRKKMSYPDTIPLYNFKSWRGYYFVRLVLWIDFKIKAPAGIDMWGEQEVFSLQDLDARWTALRSELAGYLEETYPIFRNHLVYNHPFGGRMTMRQMLMTLNDHLDHHIRQAKRILKEVE